MYRKVLFICSVCVYSSLSMESFIKTQPTNSRVCVIGAGVAGLSSARYLKGEGINFTILEATKYIGGTWRYDPRVGKDEYDMPIHTSMYKHLRTNIPKPTMQLSDFPVPVSWPSFPTWSMYYEYIKDFTKHFDLEKHIKFLHLVTSVRKEGTLWKVKHKYIPSGEEFTEDYEFVFIGSGHHSKPNMPNFEGEKLFKGTIIHSHDYREPDIYKDRRVLIVGSGPSGMDICLEVLKVAKSVIHSHHSKITYRTPFPKNYAKKEDIKCFNETGVVFVDESYEDIDDVIYATGYQYDYPFLDETAGLTITGRSVIPLHQYMVNIHQPTMVFLGLVVRACVVIAIDAQARYATALVKGNFTLPPKEKMLDVWQKRADTLRSQGRPLTEIHHLAQNEDYYYASLAEESGIRRVPPVMFKIRTVDIEAKLENLYTYRNYVYNVLDEETFTRSLADEASANIDNELNGNTTKTLVPITNEQEMTQQNFTIYRAS